MKVTHIELRVTKGKIGVSKIEVKVTKGNFKV